MSKSNQDRNSGPCLRCESARRSEHSMFCAACWDNYLEECREKMRAVVGYNDFDDTVPSGRIDAGWWREG